MSALPPSLATADEVAVLSALRRLMETRKVSASQARSLYAAWRVERSQAVEDYLSFEIVHHWRKEIDT